MSYSKYNDGEIDRLGQTLYNTKIRAEVTTDDNIGKIISIDIESGDYEIDDDLLTTCRSLQAKHPQAILWTARIGFNAVYAVGGTLTRTAL
jgi:hypothetical protein